MRSPIASHQQMERITLEDDLTAFKCPESGGIFITSQCYFRWISKKPGRLKTLPACSDTSQSEASESEQVKICPESGGLMLRFKVGHGFTFHIDRSPTGSIWLDQGEWEALKNRNFHDELHLVFTNPWQNIVRDEQKLVNHRALLKDQLGEELFTKIETIKTSLKDHPSHNLALAYLNH